MIGQTAASTIDAAAPDPKPNASHATASGLAADDQGDPGDVAANVRAEAETLEVRSSPDGDAVRTEPPREIGGRDGLEPTRYGDWEKNGRCIDF